METPVGEEKQKACYRGKAKRPDAKVSKNNKLNIVGQKQYYVECRELWTDYIPRFTSLGIGSVN
jgi:hypothetical protein